MVLLLFAADVVLGVVELSVVGEKAACVGFGAAERFERTLLSWYEGWRDGLLGGCRDEDDGSSESLRWERGVDMCVSQGMSYVRGKESMKC